MASVYSALLIPYTGAADPEQTQVPSGSIYIVRDISGVYNAPFASGFRAQFSPDGSNWYSFYEAIAQAGAPSFHQEMRVVLPQGFWLRGSASGILQVATAIISGYVLTLP